MKQITDYIVAVIELNKGITQQALELKLLDSFPSADKNTILTAISTAAQDGLVKRIEYVIGNSYVSYYFYIPANSRIT